MKIFATSAIAALLAVSVNADGHLSNATNATDMPMMNGTMMPVENMTMAPEPESNVTNATEAPVAPSEPAETVLEVLLTQPDLTVIGGAVNSTFLQRTLTSSRRNYTFFAPVDKALAGLDPKFLTPNWIIHLEQILGYHSVSNAYLTSAEVVATETLERGGINAPWNISVDDGAVTLDNGIGPAVPVVGVDFLAENGVVHKLGGFMIPTVLAVNLLQVAGTFDAFSTVVSLVVATGLEEAFSQDVTLFAPSNDFFPEELLASLEGETETIAAILSYHAVPEVYPTALLTDGLELPTLLEGEMLMVSNAGGVVSINEIPLAPVGIDTPGSNGIAQPITGVLIPKSVVLPEDNATTTTDAPVAAPVDAPVEEPTDEAAPVDAPTDPPETTSSSTILSVTILASISSLL